MYACMYVCIWSICVVCLYMYLFYYACETLYQSIRSFICLLPCLPIHVSVYLFVHPTNYLSLGLFLLQPLYPFSVCLSLCLPLSACLSVSVYLYLPISML